ncbi:hypothetical protein BD769DRAFT_1384269 [Suillus cothurnatus]|nr:hypothetical protein BD769DRAFT_1384269 [Suillus cothurnatus]
MKMVGSLLRVDSIVQNRITQCHNELLLTVDMPNQIHEEPFDYLRDYLGLAISHIPFGCDIICSWIHMNSLLQAQGKVVMPNLMIMFSSEEGPMEEVVTSVLGECTVSENRDHAFMKMEAEIASHLEADFAIIAEIKESTSFQCPAPDSMASKTLLSEDIADPNPLSLRAFIRQRSTPHQFSEPFAMLLSEYTNNDCEKTTK